MKKLIIAISISFVLLGTFSCGKNCTKGGSTSYRVNRDDFVTDQDYNDAIANLTAIGYTCQ